MGIFNNKKKNTGINLFLSIQLDRELKKSVEKAAKSTVQNQFKTTVYFLQPTKPGFFSETSGHFAFFRVF